MSVMSNRELGNSGSGHGFVVGLLCGAAVGAAVGLLFAPKRGTALRKDLAKSANDVTRRAKELYDGAADVVSDLTDRVSDLTDRATDMLEHTGKAVEKAKAHSRSEHHGRAQA
jgi:gas vesicle protein